MHNLHLCEKVNVLVFTESKDSVGVLVLDPKANDHLAVFSGDHTQLQANLQARVSYTPINAVSLIPCCFSSTEQPPYRPGGQQGPLLHRQIQRHRLLGEDTPEIGDKNCSKRKKTTLLEGRMTSAVTKSLLPSSAATMLGWKTEVSLKTFRS